MTKHRAWESMVVSDSTEHVVPISTQSVNEMLEDAALEHEVAVMMGIEDGELPGYEDSRNAQ